GAAGLRGRYGRPDARGSRLQGAEIFPGRSLGRRALAEGGERAAAAHPVLSDRRRGPHECGYVSGSTQCDRRRRLVGGAARGDGRERFLEILKSDVGLFIDIMPKVLAACLIAAFVAVLMPRETVLRWVGAESGLLGVLIATLAGVICPGGPITIYPVAAAFVA